MLLDNQAEADRRVPGRGYRTALHIATEGGYTEVVALLLGNGANVDAKTSEQGGRTALHMAVEGGYIGTVKLLLEKDANVDPKTLKYSLRVAFHTVVDNKFPGRIWEWSSGDRSVTKREPGPPYGPTPLQAAVQHGDIELVKLLLENGSDVNAESGYSKARTALELAIQGGRTDIQELLVGSGARDIPAWLVPINKGYQNLMWYFRNT